MHKNKSDKMELINKNAKHIDREMEYEYSMCIGKKFGKMIS